MNMYLAASGTTASTWVGGIAAGLAAAFAYLLPSVIAAIRKVPSIGSVVVVNLFLGWTVIGWIVALAMAFRSRPQAQARPPAATR